MIKNKEREKARMPRLNRLARLFSSVALVTSSCCCCCYLFLVHSSMQTFAPRRNEEEQVGETMRDIFCDFGEIFDVSSFAYNFLE